MSPHQRIDPDLIDRKRYIIFDDNIGNWSSTYPSRYSVNYRNRTSSITYTGGSGYENIYIKLTLPSNRINKLYVSFEFYTSTGFTYSYGDKRAPIIIMKSAPGNTLHTSFSNVYGRSDSLDGTAGTTFNTYSFEAAGMEGLSEVYLVIPLGCITDKVKIWKVYQYLTINFTFSNFLVYCNLDDIAEWVLWTDSLGNGIKIEPKDCQPIEDFDTNFIENKIPMTSPYYLKDNSIENHAVDLDLFERPYPASVWNYNDDMSSLINNGMDVANFEEPYNFSSWYLGVNNEKILNTGLEPANFEEPYNWCAWYLANDPDKNFDINTGPWEEMLGAFANNKTLTTLTIPNQVTKLGLNSFRRSNLESISLPSNIEYTEDNGIDSTFSGSIKNGEI